MQKNIKIALARIFDDIIKADRVIAAGEMECWQSVCGRYDITPEIRVAARGISFADALSSLASSGSARLKADVLSDCSLLTLSDGYCAHSEALHIIAVRLMLAPSSGLKASVYSVARANFNIEPATALYIESLPNRGVNEAIRRDYRAIFREFQCAGFHFVYVPTIIDHYRHTDPDLFHGILSFLAPQMSAASLDNVSESLLGMNTADFTKDLLCNKCGMAELRHTPPALMIKIGNSYTTDSLLANYLLIEVDADITATVREFVDSFTVMLNSDLFVINTSEERGDQFHFHGFYKQLLDLFLIRRNIRSRVIIDPAREEIWFPDIDMKATGLHRRERALYTLLICLGEKGIDFTKPRTAAALAAYNERMERLQRQYAEIYGLFGGRPEAAPDLTVPETRRPIVSCLKRAISSLTSLYNPDDYNLSKGKDGKMLIHLDRDLVFVNELASDHPVALRDSELYARWNAGNS